MLKKLKVCGATERALVWAVLTAGVFVVSPPMTLRGEFVIGGWSPARGGSYNIIDGTWTAGFREAVSRNFCDVTFLGTDTLTPAFLSDLDVLIITSVKEANNIIVAPLSSAEQDALLDFVAAGGGAYLLVDNHFFESSNQSLVSPFGVHSTANLGGQRTATITDGTHPVADGPFGNPATFTSNHTAYFDDLGAHAEPLATWGTGQTALAVIEPGALGPGSGPVVLGTDVELYMNFFPEYTTAQVIMNAIAFMNDSSLCQTILRGDCNDDGTVDVSDATLSFNVLFLGQGEFGCEDACDSNDDGRLDISDGILSLNVLSSGKGMIPPPGMDRCGPDPTEDSLGCGRYSSCAYGS